MHPLSAELRCCCCWCRGPGQIVGDTSFGEPAAAAVTVRARSRMGVLLVRHADAAALVSQPSIKAARRQSPLSETRWRPLRPMMARLQP